MKGNMRKVAIMLIVLMVVSVGFLSGCEEKETVSYYKYGVTVLNYTDVKIHVDYEVNSSHWHVDGNGDVNSRETKKFEYESIAPESERTFKIKVTASYSDIDISDSWTTSKTSGGGPGASESTFIVHGCRYCNTPSIRVIPY